jgi:hypothetical protein
MARRSRVGPEDGIASRVVMGRASIGGDGRILTVTETTTTVQEQRIFSRFSSVSLYYYFAREEVV